jgi:cyclohexyl-isocyanide hydratase
MIPKDVHLQMGSLLFEGLDQIDLTGPFEVLSRVPNSTYRIYAKTPHSVRDMNGLQLTPDAALADAPPLDVLHVPGGFGQEALMEDEEVLAWIRRQAAGACSIFSVCTGALLCGAAGLLKGRRATTHWNSFHLLPFFGAIPVDRRVVVDGSCIFAAGVTAGIDGALRLAAELRGTMRLGRFSFRSRTRRNRLSTPVHPRPLPPQYSKKRGDRFRELRPGGKRLRDESPRAWALRSSSGGGRDTRTTRQR